MINGNLALRTLFLSNGIFVFAGIAVTPIYALYAEGMGASLLIVSYLASTLFLAKIIGTISLRIVGSKIHSKKLLLISGFLLRALGWIILIFAGSLVMLFIVQAILGIGEAIGSNPCFHRDCGDCRRRTYSDPFRFHHPLPHNCLACNYFCTHRSHL
jgi:MFS family permease